MPPISPIAILGTFVAMSYGKKLPVEWKQPQGEHPAGHYGDALKPEEKMGILQPMGWFFPGNMSKQHTEACNDRTKDFRDFQGKALDGVKFSHDLWRLQAKFKDLKVMAVCAIGPPGCLDGPTLESNIKNSPGMAAMSGNMAKYRDAVAKGVSEQYDKWQKKVMVPGLPWYPAFAAFPGPMAPPMPNVPMPLITCPSAMMAEIIVPSKLKDAMVGALDQSMKDEDPDKQHEMLFDSIATPLALAFLMWMPQQQVMLVMGKGPIPTFAPPYVPVGPVVAGDNIAVPGHLMA